MHSDTLLYTTTTTTLSATTFSTPIFSMSSATEDFPPIINNAEEEEFFSCEVNYSSDHRWYFVAVAGTLLSIVSFICNFLIAFILLQKRYSHFFFLGLLAASDTFLSICYAPVIAMDVIKSRLQILWLTRLYWHYVFPLLSLCHVSMTFSSLMIILATIERYLITVKSPNLNCWRQHRGGLAFGMLGIALILRGTEIFEYTFTRNGNCTGLAEFEPALTDLVNDYVYGTLFRFYLRNIFTVFVPFFLLAYLNLNIVNTLRKQHRSAEMFRFASSDHKLKIRSATRLLVLVVFSYLIANVLNVMITAWEYIDFQSTQTSVAFDIYEVLTDVISVLYVFTCASRLFVYLLCNQEIRNAFYESLCPQGLTLLSTTEPQNEYKQPQRVDKVALSLQRSQLGTEFDRLAIAIVSPRISNASSTQHHVTELLLKESNKKHQQQQQRNGNYHSIENSIIIENPLANIDDDDEDIPFYDDD